MKKGLTGDVVGRGSSSYVVCDLCIYTICRVFNVKYRYSMIGFTLVIQSKYTDLARCIIMDHNSDGSKKYVVVSNYE